MDGETNNRLLNKLLGASREMHELEVSGEQLTDEEDQLWEDLTFLIEGYLQKHRQ